MYVRQTVQSPIQKCVRAPELGDGKRRFYGALGDREQLTCTAGRKEVGKKRGNLEFRMTLVSAA